MKVSATGNSFDEMCNDGIIKVLFLSTYLSFENSYRCQHLGLEKY